MQMTGILWVKTYTNFHIILLAFAVNKNTLCNGDAEKQVDIFQYTQIPLI